MMGSSPITSIHLWIELPPPDPITTMTSRLTQGEEKTEEQEVSQEGVGAGVGLGWWSRPGRSRPKRTSQHTLIFSSTTSAVSLDFKGHNFPELRESYWRKIVSSKKQTKKDRAGCQKNTWFLASRTRPQQDRVIYTQSYFELLFFKSCGWTEFAN
jgi:hypothetical protein